MHNEQRVPIATKQLLRSEYRHILLDKKHKQLQRQFQLLGFYK